MKPIPREPEFEILVEVQTPLSKRKIINQCLGIIGMYALIEDVKLSGDKKIKIIAGVQSKNIKELFTQLEQKNMFNNQKISDNRKPGIPIDQFQLICIILNYSVKL